MARVNILGVEIDRSYYVNADRQRVYRVFAGDAFLGTFIRYDRQFEVTPASGPLPFPWADTIRHATDLLVSAYKDSRDA